MLTVVPVPSLRSKVSPAGTVNELMFTVAHLTASSTSSRDEIVPTQSCGVDAAVAGTATMARARTRRVARRRNVDIVFRGAYEISVELRYVVPVLRAEAYMLDSRINIPKEKAMVHHEGSSRHARRGVMRCRSMQH